MWFSSLLCVQCLTIALHMVSTKQIFPEGMTEYLPQGPLRASHHIPSCPLVILIGMFFCLLPSIHIQIMQNLQHVQNRVLGLPYFHQWPHYLITQALKLGVTLFPLHPESTKSSFCCISFIFDTVQLHCCYSLGFFHHCVAR